MSSAIITITGNLSKDPELKESAAGNVRLECSIPVDQGWGDTKTTAWYQVKVFGKRVESLQSLIDQGLLHKGTIVTASGTLEAREYNSQNGGRKTSLDLSASTFDVILPPRSESSTNSTPATYATIDQVPF